MCNVYGVLHGGCAAFLVDMSVHLCPLLSCMYVEYHSIRCSSTAIFQCGIRLGFDASGMSQTMSIIYHQPAPMYVDTCSTSLTFLRAIRPSTEIPLSALSTPHWQWAVDLWLVGQRCVEMHSRLQPSSGSPNYRCMTSNLRGSSSQPCIPRSTRQERRRIRLPSYNPHVYFLYIAPCGYPIVCYARKFFWMAHGKNLGTRSRLGDGLRSRILWVQMVSQNVQPKKYHVWTEEMLIERLRRRVSNITPRVSMVPRNCRFSLHSCCRSNF